jgi:hypothetical protein
MSDYAALPRRSDLKARLSALVLAIGAMLLSCTSDYIAGGSTTETTNSVVAALKFADNAPAKNLPVKIRPNSFLSSDTAHLPAGIFETTTDSSGAFTFSALPAGAYTLYALSGDSALGWLVSGITVGKRVDLSQDTMVRIGDAILTPTGSLAGVFQGNPSVESATISISLEGTDFSKTIRPGRFFFFDKLPPSKYTVHMRIDSQDTILISGIEVRSQHTTIIPYSDAHDTAGSPGIRRFVIPPLSTAFSIKGDVSVFPLLIRLNSSIPGDSVIFACTPNPGAIRFLDSAGTLRLPFEIERWDTLARPKAAEIWVKVPIIYSQVPTPYLTMVYGTDIDSQPPNDMVFPIGEAWGAVWHCVESNGNTLADATHNGATATRIGQNQSATAVIGLGQRFDGASTFFDLGENRAFCNGSGGVTISTWINPAAYGGTILDIGAANDSSRLTLSLTNTGTIAFRIRGDDADSSMQEIESPDMIALNTWYHVCASVHLPRDSIHLYINGVLKAAAKAQFSNQIFNTATGSKHSYLGSLRGQAGFYNGLIDECRIWRSVHSPYWIRLSYLSQIDGGSIFE